MFKFNMNEHVSGQINSDLISKFPISTLEVPIQSKVSVLGFIDKTAEQNNSVFIPENHEQMLVGRQNMSLE